MKVNLYPLAASKMLRHCEIFVSTMTAMESDEMVELAFNEFISSSDRTLQYLNKELKKIGGYAPNWFVEKRNELPDRDLFYQLRHILAHHYFVPLTPVMNIKDNQILNKGKPSEYLLDLLNLPEDKDFKKYKNTFIEIYGQSIDTIFLCSEYYRNLKSLIDEAENKFENRDYYLRSKIKSTVTLKDSKTLLKSDRKF